MRVRFIILILANLFFAKPILAGDPPQLVNPTNNSTVTSSKLEWQTPSYPLYTSGSFYMIQVDDQQSFANPEKNNVYLTNNYYTPKLNPGTWYWRVKAKDASGTWSSWSNDWSFILTDSTSTPTPSPTPTANPSPTPSSSSTTTQSSSFTVSNIPSQINSDQSFSVTVNLSLPNNPNSTFYLKGAFKTTDGSNYFGKTKVSGSWVKNGSSYSNQFTISTDSSGMWNGSIEIQADSEDSGFIGTGNYIFKVARYSSSGSGPTWSNESTINIIGSALEVEQTTSQLTSSNDSISNTPSPTTSFKSKIVKSSSEVINKPSVATIAGINNLTNPSSTSSSTIALKKQKQINPLLIAGVIFILIGTFSLGYIYLKRK